ncbi:MAG: DNA-formamidopyrimidine glycosylase family protein [Ilumatobacteraceae bacterium]
MGRRIDRARGQQRTTSEFLGDAVLGWVVADLVFRNFQRLEGVLTDLRKSVVNANALAEVAVELGIGEHLLLGRGEDAAGGRGEDVDPLRCDGGGAWRRLSRRGRQAAFDLIERLFSGRLDDAVDSLHRLDYKSALQELLARDGKPSPDYRVTSTGPDHDKTFTAKVMVSRQTIGARGASASRPNRPRRPPPTSRSSSPDPMPELPEVETVRRGLERHAVGRRIGRAEVGRVTDGAPDVARGGHRRPDGHDDHGRQPARQVPAAAPRSGRRDDDPPPDERPGARRRCRCRTATAHPRRAPLRSRRAGLRRELWFVDPRTFGEVVVFDPEHVETELPDVARLGIDPIVDDLSLPVLRGILRSRRRLLAVVARPAPHRRNRQHLCRRDPARGPSPTRSHQQATSCRRRRSLCLHTAIHRILNEAIGAGVA